MGFTLYPALDILAGEVVRLRQGDFREVTAYSTDPVALAQAYEAAGATHLHLVDLAAAKAGQYTLAPLLQQLASETSLIVQTGGGIRDEDDIERALSAGASRVVIGSTSVRNPGLVKTWIRTYPAGTIVVALDVRKGKSGSWHPATDGWTEEARSDLFALAVNFASAGLEHLLVTDITRDGMLSGVNIALYETLASQVPNVRIQASGGVKDVHDIRAAQVAGCGGVVLGKALLEGRFTMRDAQAVTA